MPRRTRTQVPIRRKRTPPTAPSARRAAVDELEPVSGSEESGPIKGTAPSPYIRREPRVDVSAARDATARAPVRQARALITDYGYVTSELEKVGYTFAGLILLLIVISRLLR